MSIKAFKFNRMKKRQFSVIGVMSGTSCDGIDLAYCQFKQLAKNKWSYSIVHARTIPYDAAWQEKLLNVINAQPSAIGEINRAYTALVNKVILTFIDDFELTDLDLICSHGHTVWHKPKEGLTLQIGNLESIADGMPCPVVCDFRTQDVTLGGQGAPLVPIGDRLLFSDFDACLNLGGFANISYRNEDLATVAFDLCPFNIVLNYWAQKFGAPYDAHGDFARSGSLNLPLLERLNALDYYRLSPPKSLGLEWVHSNFYPLYKSYHCDPVDWLATASRHMAHQIDQATLSFDRVLITGGGAYNSFVMELLDALAPGKFILPTRELIDYKEALIFGLLGVLRFKGEINCLSSVTGASKDHSSGVIWT
jgi:anhydro-N-acetylmuramic acid kinase